MARSSLAEPIVDVGRPEALSLTRALIRDRRKALGLTQKDVARLLAETAMSLSRSHLANLEAGRHQLLQSHVVALDDALGLSGELVDLYDEETGTSVDRRSLGGLTEVARTIQLSFGAEQVESPDGEVAEGLAQWLSTPQGATRVVEGTRNVRRAINALLLLAKRSDLPRLRAPILLAHAPIGSFGPAGYEPEEAEFRRALTSALLAGWKVTRIIGQPAPGGEADLVRALCPFIASSQFEALQTDPSRYSAAEGCVVVPGLAAIQLMVPDDDNQFSHALIHRGHEILPSFEQQAKQLAERASKFLRRYNRSDRSVGESPAVSAEEVAFRATLNDIAKFDGDCGLAIGRFPSSSCPPGVYAAQVKRRADAPDGPDGPTVNRLISLQANRHATLWSQLNAGTLRLRCLVTEQDLADTWTANKKDSKLWRLQKTAEFAKHVAEVLRLMDADVAFEVGIVSNPDHYPLRYSSWEVRQGSSGGVVLVQARFGGVREDLDIRIDQRSIVQAYMAYFQWCWGDSAHVETDQRKVRGFLADLRCRALAT